MILLSGCAQHSSRCMWNANLLVIHCAFHFLFGFGDIRLYTCVFLYQILTLTIRDGRHAKQRQNGRVVFYTTWGVFILYNATSLF